MGFNEKNIPISGDTCIKDIQISWTDIGREYLIGKRKNRRNGLNIKYFALFDDDKNYFNEQKQENGFIPNITGVDNQCINGNKINKLQPTLNLNKVGLVIIKDYTITIPLSQNNWLNCSEESLRYDIFLDGVSIFKLKPLYQSLLIPGSIVPITTINDIKNTFNQTYVKDEYSNVVNIDYDLQQISSELFSVRQFILTINAQAFNSVLTDNSNQICNNVIVSSISSKQSIIINETVIETINFNNSELPEC